MNVHLALYIAAFVCFLLAAIGVPTIPPRYNLIAVGLACVTATLLF